MQHVTAPLVGLFVLAGITTGQDRAEVPDPANRRVERDVIYYDFIEYEGGPLRGGIVQVDPSDPLHADTGTLYATAAEPFVTLVDNGPTSNRVDLVFVGDGYTAPELGAYASDVDSIVPVFFAKVPLDEYSSHFNVHRVDVTSNESGVDNDPVQGILRDTALDMTYWCGGTERLLCVNVGKATNKANSAPAVDQILALANSSKYGGAGYPGNDLGTLAADNGAAIEIALHEFGHSMGDLADEYDYGGPQTYTGGEPSAQNVSIHEAATMESLEVKWWRWLSDPSIGTFEGANYSVFGIYRPNSNSLMRNLGQPFGKVNREQMIFKIYETVDPIDDATPASENSPTAVYFVDPVHPTGHLLDVQWSLDGVPIVGATGETLDASTLSLTPGDCHVLSVTVVDNTSMVINETKRANLMTETRSWTLSEATLVSDNPLGINPTSYTVTGSHGGRPVIGGSIHYHVDAIGTTGHTSSVVVGFLSPLQAVLGSGQVLLMNVVDPAGEVLGYPIVPGNFDLDVPVANDPNLCGVTVYTQAIHLFGVAPFALSNRHVLTFGYD